jgi:hypothetical protein
MERSVALTRDGLEAVEVGDVRMVERGKEPCLALEARKALAVRSEGFGQELQRDEPAESGVGGPEDLAHPSRAERCDDFVRS